MANDLTRPSASAIKQTNKRLEIGLMGIIFGDASEKPGNIAAAVIVLSFVAIIPISIWMPDTDGYLKHQLLTLFGGVITGAVGFVFGRTTSPP